MQTEKKNFRDGITLFTQSAQFCLKNFIPFCVPAGLSFACVAIGMIIVNALCFALLPVILYAVFMIAEIAFVYLYLTGYISIISRMLDGIKPSFSSFFEIFRDPDRCLKIFLFLVIIIACVAAVLFTYFFFALTAVKSGSLTLGTALFGLGGLIFSACNYTATVAMVLYVTRQSPKMTEVIEDSVKLLVTNILAFIAIIVCLALLTVIYNCAVSYILFTLGIGGLGSAVITIVLFLAYSVFYSMLTQTTVIKAVKEMSGGLTDKEEEKQLEKF